MAGKKKTGGVERLGGSTPGDATPPDYAALLADLKARIGQARMLAALSVSREIVLLYWSIGRDISGGRLMRAGAPRSSTAWLATSRAPFPACRGCRPAISNT